MNSRRAPLQFQIGKVLDWINSTLAYGLIGWFAQRPGEEAGRPQILTAFLKPS
jgi:hypothetical protein